MIQIVGQGIEQMVHGNVWGAGERFATVAKAAFGMITIELPQVDDMTFVPMDEQRFISEFIPAYLREFQASDEQVNSTVTCVFGLVHAAQQAVSNPALRSRDFLTSGTAFLEGAIKVVDALEVCEHSRIYLPTLGRFIQVFVQHPFQVYLQMTINNVLESPTIMSSYLNMNVHNMAGKYAVAGKDAAQYTKTILKNILHF